MSSDDGSAVSWGIIGILLMLDICFVTNYYVIRSLRQFTDANTATIPADKMAPLPQSGLGSVFEIFVIGFLFGRVKAMPLSVQTFPQWRPIQYRIGLVFTTVLVLLSLIVLSPQYFSDYIGIDLSSVTLSTDFCSDTDIDDGLQQLEWLVDNITNYKQATLQYEHMMLFHEALVNDTSLYGEDGYTCPSDGTTQTETNDLSGEKNDWQDLTVEPASLYGNFFPGYCTAAQQSALDAASTTTCDEEQCACPTVPSTSATRFFGVNGKKLCFLRICMTMPTVCPSQTNDAQVNLQNYREAQLALADDVNSVDELDDEVYDTIEDTLSDTLATILYQLDVGSNIYSLYACAALFFPTPLIVFRLPYTIAIKKFLFGAQQKWFILLFIGFWWGVSYIQDLLLTDNFTVFLQNLQAGDPCFLDGDYLASRQTIINDICEDFVEQETYFETSRVSVNQILYEVKIFASESSCSCYFPMESMYELRSDNYPTSEVSALGFTDTSDSNFCKIKDDDCTVYRPGDDIEYLGNRTLCTDGDYARELALEASATDGNADWSQIANLWIGSGLIASFLVKIALTNFALALLRLADPFVSCNGEFLWIPTKIGSGFGNRDRHFVFWGFKHNKEGTLKNLAFRDMIVWCIVMHACLFNLMYSAYNQYTSSNTSADNISYAISSDDAIILSTSLGISVVFVLCGLIFLRRLKKNIPSRRGNDNDTENGEEDFSSDDFGVDE